MWNKHFCSLSLLFLHPNPPSVLLVFHLSLPTHNTTSLPPPLFFLPDLDRTDRRPIPHTHAHTHTNCRLACQSVCLLDKPHPLLPPCLSLSLSFTHTHTHICVTTMATRVALKEGWLDVQVRLLEKEAKKKTKRILSHSLSLSPSVFSRALIHPLDVSMCVYM